MEKAKEAISRHWGPDFHPSAEKLDGVDISESAMYLSLGNWGSGKDSAVPYQNLRCARSRQLSIDEEEAIW